MTWQIYAVANNNRMSSDDPTAPPRVQSWCHCWNNTFCVIHLSVIWSTLYSSAHNYTFVYPHYWIGRWSAIGCSKSNRFLYISLWQGNVGHAFAVRSWYTLYSSIVGFIQKGAGAWLAWEKRNRKCGIIGLQHSFLLFFIPSLQLHHG